MAEENFERIMQATKDDYELHILNNPLLGVLINGQMTRTHYIAYLRETYHLVRHTSKARPRLALRDSFFKCPKLNFGNTNFMKVKNYV